MSEVQKIVLLINPSREHMRGLLNGIAQYARLHGPWTFYRPLEYREPRFRRGLLAVLKFLRMCFRSSVSHIRELIGGS